MILEGRGQLHAKDIAHQLDSFKKDLAKAKSGPQKEGGRAESES